MSRPMNNSPKTAGLQREAIERLWRSHRRWVAAVIYAHKPHDVDLEDLVQDVAMRLVKNIDQLDLDRIRPWLRTVAVNVARSAGRRSTTRNKSSAGIDTHHLQRLPETNSNLLPVSSSAGGERGRLALQLMQELPTHYREPLLLSLRGLSHRQISRTTDLPITTIETRLIRARKMLREALERYEGEARSSTRAAIPHPTLLNRSQSS